MTIDEKLDEVIARLERIEQRQISTTKIVKQVQEQESPVVGSFGTTEAPEDGHS